MTYDEVITRLARAEARARQRWWWVLARFGLMLTGWAVLGAWWLRWISWLLVVVVLSGCTIAAVVVGVVVDAAVGTVGIVQRERQTDELVGVRADLTALRRAIVPQLRTMSDRLREESLR